MCRDCAIFFVPHSITHIPFLYNSLSMQVPADYFDNRKNSRAGFQAVMSYHACLSNDMSAWARQ